MNDVTPAPAPASPLRRPWPNPVTRATLAQEVLLVLGLSLGAAAVYAVISLLSAPLRGQQVALYAPTPLAYQLFAIATDLVPVLLAVHLLRRTGDSRHAIGLDFRRARSDSARGVALAALIGSGGLVLYVAAVRLGVNRAVVPAPPPGHWWTIPILLLGALRSAFQEEVIVVGYLLRRLEQLGWSRRKSLVASALLRGSYHLYQGFGGFVGNVVMGLVFARVFQNRQRVAPLIVAHFLLDAVAGLGFLLLHGVVPGL